MKAFVISAIIGAAALGIQGVNAVQDLKRSAAENLDIVKREPQEHCWELPDGQVQCGYVKEKREPQEHCWELPDGQVQCGYTKEKREPQEHCWELPDGQVQCGYAKEKRNPQEHCWELPDGQVQCGYLKEKRDPQGEHCWETPDGQVQCSYKNKRDAQGEHCWETPDGQVQCSYKKRNAQSEHCWELPDGQVQCGYAKDKRDGLAEPGVLLPPGPVANGTSKRCGSWWLVVSLKAQPDPCLSALVLSQNITFSQFRKLNPSVNSACNNLRVGYAYCVKDVSNPQLTAPASKSTTTSSAAATSAAPLLPAVRVTEARTGTKPHGLPTPPLNHNGASLPATITTWSDPFAGCTVATIVNRNCGASIYGVDSAGHTCSSMIIPEGTDGPHRDVTAVTTSISGHLTTYTTTSPIPPVTEKEWCSPSTSVVSATNTFVPPPPPTALASAAGAPSASAANTTVPAGSYLYSDLVFPSWATIGSPVQASSQAAAGSKAPLSLTHPTTLATTTKGPSHEGDNTGVIADNDDNRPTPAPIPTDGR
ncbi:MAG: hypothetical protein Q9201_004006 [Fulgogasparrea decipioides]